MTKDPGAETKITIVPMNPMESTVVHPEAAVLFAWGISSKFSTAASNKEHGESQEKKLNAMLEEYKKAIDDAKDGKHRAYYTTLVAAIGAAVKNLETCLRHRNDNFGQDEELRKQEFEAIDRTKTFGLNLENAVPKLVSSAALGGVTGLSITSFLGELDLPDVWQNAILLVFLGIGYLITDFVVLPLVSRRKNCVVNRTNTDKHRHYNLYWKRCKVELDDLYGTLLFAYRRIDPNYKPPKVIKNGVEVDWDVRFVIPENEEKIVYYPTWPFPCKLDKDLDNLLT